MGTDILDSLDRFVFWLAVSLFGLGLVVGVALSSLAFFWLR